MAKEKSETFKAVEGAAPEWRTARALEFIPGRLGRICELLETEQQRRQKEWAEQLQRECLPESRRA